MAWDSLKAPSGGKSSCLIGTSNLYRPFSSIALVTLAQCHLEFPPNSLAIPAWWPPSPKSTFCCWLVWQKIWVCCVSYPYTSWRNDL
jgi:hypothetical protein